MLYHPVKIGSLSLPGNLFLAPVAGYSDRAFRSVCVKGGCDFEYTEMVSAEALVRGSGKTECLMKRAPVEKAYAVQIFGGSDETMAKAAGLVLSKTSAECIDINAGCPVPKIIKTGAGSSLTRDPDRLYKIVMAVVQVAAAFDGLRPEKESQPDGQSAPDSLLKQGPVPVTVKIRSGWDDSQITWKEAAQAAIEAGAAAITMHPRTRAQGYEGKADWEKLKELVSLAAGRIPIFGSGDIFTPEDAVRMLEQTGVDGVMFARGAMGKPFIFRQTKDLIQTGKYDEIPLSERIAAGFEELALLAADMGEEPACREMRKRFCAYSKGIEGGAQVRAQIVHSSSIAEYKAVLGKFCGSSSL